MPHFETFEDALNLVFYTGLALYVVLAIFALWTLGWVVWKGVRVGWSIWCALHEGFAQMDGADEK